jgi:hypothetical protein
MYYLVEFFFLSRIYALITRSTITLETLLDYFRQQYPYLGSLPTMARQPRFSRGKPRRPSRSKRQNFLKVSHL